MSACRERYDAALRRAWRPGDCFRMAWELPGAPELRVWYHGRVLRRVHRAPTDPRRDSPWEALTVAWDTGEETNVSMWEIDRDRQCDPSLAPGPL